MFGASGISEQKGSAGPYGPLQKAECDKAFGPLVFDSVEDTINQIGGTSILTEFGAMVYVFDFSSIILLSLLSSLSLSLGNTALSIKNHRLL